MKKWTAAAMAIVMLLTSFSALAAGLDNFTEVKTYQEGTFQDIKPGDWFYQNVVNAYQYGLANGTGDGMYSPDGQVSIAEAITFAARVNQTYHSSAADFSGIHSQQWYDPYVAYAEQNQIIEMGKFAMAYDRPATRGEVAYIFSRTLPESEYQCINTQVNAIPDMDASAAYYSEALLLFRAGVLTGKDEYGSFAPIDNITRAEIAAMIDRIIDTTQRKHFIPSALPTDPPAPVSTPTPAPVSLNAEQIAEMAGPSVFLITLYDKSGNAVSSGSGFFIDSDGTAVTNYHVIDDAYSAKITMVDGRSYDVSTIYGYSAQKDLAIIKVNGAGFAPLPLADSTQIKSGQKIFCMGSPLGFDNTISEGIISNTYRELNGTVYFQISAPISHGSSGGAVLNDRCEVIGVSSAGIDEAQNLNFAVHSNQISTIDRSNPKTLAQIYEKEHQTTPEPSNIRFYEENVNIPDYTSITGVTSIQKDISDDGKFAHYVYPFDADQTLAYMEYLLNHGWKITSESESNGILIYIFSKNNVAVGVSADGTYTLVTVPIVSGSSGNTTTQAFYSGTKVPEYTAVTGVPLKSKEARNSGDGYMYVYSLDNDNILKYIDYLQSQGFKLFSSEKDDARHMLIFSLYKGADFVSIAAVYDFGEVWILP